MSSSSDTLARLVDLHGSSVVHDADQCRQALLDVGVEAPTAELLSLAVQSGACDRLTGSDADFDTLSVLELAIGDLTRFGLPENTARGVATTWAEALGMALPSGEDMIPSLPPPEDIETLREGDRDRFQSRNDRIPTATEWQPGMDPLRTVVVAEMGEGQYRQLADAVRAVMDGTRIIVRPGNYQGPVEIGRNIEIVGEGPEHRIILTSTAEATLECTAHYAAVYGITIRQVGRAEGMPGFACHVKSGKSTFENCDFSSDTLSAVVVEGPTNPSFLECSIHDSPEAGFYFWREAGGIVERCRVTGMGKAAIGVTGGARPVVRETQLANSCRGLNITKQGRGSFERCTISNNEREGVYIKTSGEPHLRGCRIADNGTYGVRARQSAEGSIEQCQLSGNSKGNWSIEEGSGLVARANKE
ncbi:right-handed parallel beta-helix repeat-containing protein [bacterium]|nr:right-handed parallel beta-helix repeat-containing protein [bacterium]